MSCILLFELDFGLGGAGEIIHGVIKQIGVNKGLMIILPTNINHTAILLDLFECAYSNKELQ